MSSETRTLIKASDIMRKAKMMDPSTAPRWKPTTKYRLVDAERKEVLRLLAENAVSIALADLTAMPDAQAVEGVLERHAAVDRKLDKRLSGIRAADQAAVNEIVQHDASRRAVSARFDTAADHQGAGFADNVALIVSQVQAIDATVQAFPIHASSAQSGGGGASSAPVTPRPPFTRGDCAKAVQRWQRRVLKHFAQ
jgi:hypothetical protein